MRGNAATRKQKKGFKVQLVMHAFMKGQWWSNLGLDVEDWD